MRQLSWLFLLALLAATAACGRGATVPAGPDGLQAPTSGQKPAVEQLRAVQQADDDRDGVPDGVEISLGTDMHFNDTDHDGLTDHYELWGCQGLAVGIVGSLANLPDANGNGLIAPLDQGDMGGQVLKQASAVLGIERVPALLPEEGYTLANDMDGDGIPNDFELGGFYFEYDANYEPWFVKWDQREYFDVKYFKTDPTQWSTDGDPFSDWEEATKINLDQRVKYPGDHPCIPAYPDVHFVLDKYTITLNQDVTIANSSGKQTESSWTNGVDSNWSQVTENSDEFGFGGYGSAEFGIPWGAVWDTEFEIKAGFNMKWNVVESTNTETSSVVKSSTSGLSADEWSTARSTGSNSIEAAFLNLNMHMVNTGTLAASNIVAIANLRLGNFILQNLTVGNGENGELPGRSAQTITLQASTTGRPTFDYPTGRPLTLTINQLRSIQAGAPLSLDVISFKADTLVWQRDPETGRRLFLSMGDWSPYDAAIRNSTARVVLDFNDDPSFVPQLFSGLPIKRMDDLRVACFPSNGTYFGSPPDITLLDAFIWAFEMQGSDEGPIMTVRDGISNWKHTSNVLNWEFSYDRETAEKVLADPQRYPNLFLLPLEPGNPTDRIYKCTAPPNGSLASPQIYWALMEPLTRKIRAYSRDLRGIKEMRFKPDPNADYDGELMQVGYDINDPDMAFFYTYEVPQGYHWTGFEQVVAINADDKRSVLKIQIDGDQLGVQTGGGTEGIAWDGSGIQLKNFSFASGLGVNPPFDLQFSQTFLANTLLISVAPTGGQVHDAFFVVDGLNPDGSVKPLIDYNYLRKAQYASTPLVSSIDVTTTNVAPPVHSYGVRSGSGAVSVLTPILSSSPVAGGKFRWQVAGLVWRSYEGI